MSFWDKIRESKLRCTGPELAKGLAGDAEKIDPPGRLIRLDCF